MGATRGIPVAIESSIPNPTFTAPSINENNDTLAFRLQVTDNSGQTSNDSVIVTVLNNESSNVAPVYFDNTHYYSTHPKKIQGDTNRSGQGTSNDSSIPDCSKVKLWGHSNTAYSPHPMPSPKGIFQVTNPYTS